MSLEKIVPMCNHNVLYSVKYPITNIIDIKGINTKKSFPAQISFDSPLKKIIGKVKNNIFLRVFFVKNLYMPIKYNGMVSG